MRARYLHLGLFLGLLGCLIGGTFSSVCQARELFFSSEIDGLLSSCSELLTRDSVSLGELDSSEATAEYLHKLFQRPDLEGRFDKTPLHGVSVLLTDSNGHLLLSKRAGSHGAGLWATPGGHMESGETVFETAARETLEETGVEIMDLELLGVTLDHFAETGKTYYTYHVAAKIRSGTPTIMEPEKVASSWDWYDPKQFPAPLFRSVSRVVEMGVFGSSSKILK